MSVHAPEELLLGFATALRAAGVGVTSDRAQTFLAATALVGLADRDATYRAGTATLCAGPEDLDRFDQVFRSWFDVRAELPRPAAAPSTSAPRVDLPEEEGGGTGEARDDTAHLAASSTEVLRHRDVATLSAGDKQRLDQMFSRLRVRPPRRRTPRHEAWHRGAVDGSRTLRASLRRMGEPATIEHRRRRVRARRVVLLVDVSGSMSDYADAVLRLAHRIATGAGNRWGSRPVEVFTLGTRLTRVTRAMRLHDPDRALAAAGETVPDWSGGTRLGETLKVFLDRWGARGLARGAVVVVFSDGWERGDASTLGEQAERLHRLAHRVVWVNPHRGKDGYAPVQQGVLAVLPHVDDFLAGHSLATFSTLLEVLADA
ncbi:MAG: vWA domain-containing protein [Marmoricola sp.]